MVTLRCLEHVLEGFLRGRIEGDAHGSLAETIDFCPMSKPGLATEVRTLLAETTVSRFDCSRIARVAVTADAHMPSMYGLTAALDFAPLPQKRRSREACLTHSRRSAR